MNLYLLKLTNYLKRDQTLARFSPENFHAICDELSMRDKDLKFVIDGCGYPPMWTRPNTFETLVHIILEQQVSLASALAALNKLREKLKKITPEKILSLADEELRACYFSRQKIVYIRSLANAIISKKISLSAMERLPDQKVRANLVALKGIGNWTVDVYLIFVLQRTDIFPIGDLAAVNALKEIKKLPKEASKAGLLDVINSWSPYRTIATMILWHYYLSQRVKQKSAGATKVEKAIVIT
jgi:DNA-3-methyladenine glycosylase II